MKRIVTAVAVVLLFASTALADGAETFAKKCAACHGKAGEGAKMSPKAIAGTASAEVLKVINEGKGGYEAGQDRRRRGRGRTSRRAKKK